MYKIYQYSSIVGNSDNKRKLLVRNQSAGDIVKALLVAVRLSLPDVCKIAYKFKQHSNKATALAVYDFMRKNYIYNKESSYDQTAKTFKRILSDSKKGTTGDCKHYSTTAAAICKCLNMPVYFRIIDQIGRLNHIFVVLKYPNHEIIIDGTSPYFNVNPSYNRKVDIKV
jgi:hypothetical protein